VAEVLGVFVTPLCRIAFFRGAMLAWSLDLSFGDFPQIGESKTNHGSRGELVRLASGFYFLFFTEGRRVAMPPFSYQ